MTEQEREGGPEGFQFKDKRKIDPQTYVAREGASTGPAADAAGPAGQPPTGAADLTDEEVNAVAAAMAQAEEAIADTKRITAEYANYRRRVERDREAQRELAVAAVLAELLPVLDDIARAREHGDLDGAFKAVGESVESVVAKFGLEPFGAQDEPFDPTRHEAMLSETREGLDGPVISRVFRTGYAIGERVVRPAQVAVADSE